MGVPLQSHLGDKDRRKTTNLEQTGPELVVFTEQTIKFSPIEGVRSGKGDLIIIGK